jgi:phosphoribosylglycinamide formyltransferase-1
MTGKKRIGILISGRGSNMRSLIDACRRPDYPAEIVVVVSNRPEAPGLAIARDAGIPALAIDHKAYPNRAAFEAVMDAALRQAGVEIVCNAGFMRLLTADFVEAWRDRMLNIHPSLLPSFKGLHTHERALEAGVKITGCTVHFVRADMDAGPIVAQAAVPVEPGDDADLLAARVLAAEHQLYPMALELVAAGRVTVVEERVVFRGASGNGDPARRLFAPALAP